MKKHRSGFTTSDHGRGQGAGRFESAAYTAVCEHFERPATPQSVVRRGYETTSKAFIVAVGLVIALCGCVTHELEIRMSGARMLNQGELEHLFYAERLVEFSSPEGAASVTYHPDGRQEIEWANGQDTGSFRIENEQFCSTWARLRKGEESCSKIYWISEKEYEFISSDGTYAATMRLR